MNLLMISGDRTLPSGKHGAFWYTLEILREHFERIDVICPRVSSPSPNLQPFPNVSLHPSPWPLLLQPLWIVRKGKELIARHQHRVMTVHEYPPFYNGLGATFLSRATKIPYAAEVHHIVGYPIASSLAEWVGRWLSQIVLPIESHRASALRVVNTDVRGILKRWGTLSEKIRVVPSFYIDTSLWKPDATMAKKYDLVSCGRLVANKGMAELLDALKELPGVSLLVIGDGPLCRGLERRAETLGLSPRVTFAGWLPSQGDVAAALRSARVFVMNSRSEGGPRVVLEAMAAGLPVVATAVGIVPDVIRDGENGVIVPMETSALTDAIRRLLADPSLQGNMGREAVRVAERFERTKTIAGYARFLQSLAR